MGLNSGFASPDYVTLGRLSKHVVLSFLIDKIGLSTSPVVVMRTKRISAVKLSEQCLAHAK